MPHTRPDPYARLPGLLSRDELLALVGLELEAFNSLRRRNQLPQRPPRELTPQEADARGWSPYSALALVVALEMVDRYKLSRTRAAEIAARVYVVQERWADISKTGLLLADGNDPGFHVLFASIDLPGVRVNKRRPDPTIAVGTLSEIAAEHPLATGIIAISITRCAALMRQRAARGKIDLSEFWAPLR